MKLQSKILKLLAKIIQWYLNSNRMVRAKEEQLELLSSVKTVFVSRLSKMRMRVKVSETIRINCKRSRSDTRGLML